MRLDLNLENIKYLDFRSINILGHCDKVILNAAAFNKEALEHKWGININNNTWMPDFSSSFMDPFAVENTLIVMCNNADSSRSLLFNLPHHDKALEIDLGLYIFNEFNCDLTTASKNFSFSSIAEKDALSNIRSEIASVIWQTGMECQYHYAGSVPEECRFVIKAKNYLHAADCFYAFRYIARSVAMSYNKKPIFISHPVSEYGPMTMKGLGSFSAAKAEAFAFSHPNVNSYRSTVKYGEIEMIANPYLAFFALYCAEQAKIVGSTTSATSKPPKVWQQL